MGDMDELGVGSEVKSVEPALGEVAEIYRAGLLTGWKRYNGWVVAGRMDMAQAELGEVQRFQAGVDFIEGQARMQGEIPLPTKGEMMDDLRKWKSGMEYIVDARTKGWSTDAGTMKMCEERISLVGRAMGELEARSNP